jgi:hypothetical protein
MRLTLILPLALAAVAPAQTVGTAYRTVTLAPEEISVEMVLATPSSILFEQAVALLAPLNITPQNLKSVGTLRESTDQVGWQFSLIRPYNVLDDTLKRLEQTRRKLREDQIGLTYQFFLRAAPKTIDATRRKVLSELVAEARRSAGSSGKLRSVTLEPTPETVDAGRPSMLFGQASGALQYNFSVIAVFENE